MRKDVIGPGQGGPGLRLQEYRGVFQRILFVGAEGVNAFGNPHQEPLYDLGIFLHKTTRRDIGRVRIIDGDGQAIDKNVVSLLFQLAGARILLKRAVDLAR